VRNFVVLFCMVTGSQAYNLSFDKSDTDYFGVFLCPTNEIFSVSFSGMNSISTLPADPKPDFTMHEASTFAHLLLQGNPFAIESLFARCDHSNSANWYKSGAWEWLEKHRKSFLTQRAVDEYLNYIRNYLDIHRKSALPWKRLYHTLRLLLELNLIVQGKEPVVYWAEGSDEHHLLWKLKKGHFSEVEFQSLVNTHMKHIEETRHIWSTELPVTVNTKILQDWLLHLRMCSFGS